MAPPNSHPTKYTRLTNTPASLYAWSKLWSPSDASNPKQRLHIPMADVAILNQSGNNIMSWLFTGKDGHILKKSNKNCTSKKFLERLIGIAYSGEK